MPDVMTRLNAADPLSENLDPGEARHLLERARTITPATRAPRRGLAVPVAGAAAVATAAAVGVVVLGGSAPLGPGEALARAATRTAAFDSGVITYSLQGSGNAYVASGTQRVRFDGDDFEIVQKLTEKLPSGSTETHDITIRQVNGHEWIRKDDGDARWDMIGNTPAGVHGHGMIAQADVDNQPLIELVKKASDVRQEGSTFRATVSGAALAALPSAPFAMDRGPVPGDVAVAVTLTDDGTIGRLEIALPGSTRVAEYSELGVPQQIEEPQQG